MISRQELQGQWNQIVGQVRERWGQLTNDDLEQAEGNVEQLVGVIQQKTGESRRAIEDFLDQIADNGESFFQRAKSSIHDCADMAREQYEHVTQRVRDSYGQAEQLVKRRPAESAALVFGVGLIAGVLVSTLLRRS